MDEEQQMQDIQTDKAPSPPPNKDVPAAPSGFVLKLFQMVNGAPDEVISWIPSGDAFLIQNLARLESEALPRYFRHSRFQSLVRQLNFYNFRKINRERTFWVYAHPLFHRDRPTDLHLLKRRAVSPTPGNSSSSSRARRNSAGKNELGRSPDAYAGSTCGTGDNNTALDTMYDCERDRNGRSVSPVYSERDEIDDAVISKKRKDPGADGVNLRSRRRRKSDTQSQDDGNENLGTVLTSSPSYDSVGEDGSSPGAGHVRRNSHTRATRSSKKGERKKSKAGDSSEPVSRAESDQEESYAGEQVTPRESVVIAGEDPVIEAREYVDISKLEEVDQSTNNIESPVKVVETKDENAQKKTNRALSRTERMEQSLMVSQVAQKLEEYARRASGTGTTDGRVASVRGKGSRGSTARGAAAAIITPPTAANGRLSDTMKYNALTYDDEVAEMVTVSEQCHTAGREHVDQENISQPYGTTVVTDGDETSSGEDDVTSSPFASGSASPSGSVCRTSDLKGRKPRFPQPVSQSVDVHQSPTDRLSCPPVNDTLMIAIIHRKLLSCLELSAYEDNMAEFSCVAGAALAKFCMSTPPRDRDIESKTRKFLSTCDLIDREFQRYCAALCPVILPPEDKFSSFGNTLGSFHQRRALPRMEPEGVRYSAKDDELDRLFRAFAVNYMGEIVRRIAHEDGRGGNKNLGLEQSEKAALQASRDAWFESATKCQ